MSHSTRPDHVRIDINHAPDQMSATFHRGCVVSVIPEGTLPFLPGVEFLSRSPGSQLHGFRDDIIVRVQYRQTDMIGSHRMVQYAEPASRLRRASAATVFCLLKISAGILFYGICGLCATYVPEYDVCLPLPFS